MSTYHAIRFFLNLSKEEAWLGQMSREGWHLRSVSTWNRYTFEKGEPQNRNYRIDCRTFSKQDALSDYVSLFQSCGWTCVDPRLHRINCYFYVPEDGMARDIFSDATSKSRRYLRLAQGFLYSALATSLPYIVMYATGTIRLSDVRYLTPGLWQMPMERFIPHFLFETPFVVMRAMGFLLPVFLLCFYAYYWLRILHLYKQEAPPSA